MEFTDYTITSGGISITVPVFHGAEDACRMNLFYESVLKELYTYGRELTENNRRAGFFCHPSVSEENDILTVCLQLTHRRVGAPSLRKVLVHRWQDGWLIREKKPRAKIRRHTK